MQWNAERKNPKSKSDKLSYFQWIYFLLLVYRYAKALHYKEHEFHEDKSPQVLEALILINNKLQQKEAAEGLLEYVMTSRNGEEEPKVENLIKLSSIVIIV